MNFGICTPRVGEPPNALVIIFDRYVEHAVFYSPFPQIVFPLIWVTRQ